uniref:Putative pol polyprotein n=1 Tax=Anopheles darlingi TaxID=43151 RepID=A0A2M4CV35_ANODA
MDSVRVIVPRLSNDNYASWSFKVQMLLQREDVWHAVEGNKPETVTTAWTKANTKAKAIIGLHIEDDQITLIRDCEDAKSAWEALKKFHDNVSEVYLLKKLTSLTLAEGQSMEQHLSTFSELIQRIGASGESIPRKWQVAMLLCSLPPSYDPLTTAIELTNINELTVESVKSKLLAEAEKRKERAGNIESENEKAMRSEVFHRNKKPAGVVCYNCNKPGHLKRNCRLLRNDEAKRVENNNEKPAEECAFTISQEEATEWYVDSGASRHMTGNKEFFNQFSATNTGTVTLANGQKTRINGTGRGTLICTDSEGKPRSILLSDVLYVPKLTSGLISVRSLTRKGMTVLFTGEQCRIKGENKEVIATASSGSLYKLHTTEKALKGLFQTHHEKCIHSLHRRFGHRECGVIEKMCKESGLKVKDCRIKSKCEICLKSKMSRKPFPKKSFSETSEILQLIHTDISGPFGCTVSGYKYYMCIIDDYSRMTFLYLLKHKSEAEDKIREFVAFCKTQIGKTPRVIRSDNGGEYTGNQLKNFLKREGIVSQLTAPYSPQQNGVAERKNRYIQEMVRCMLADAKMEKKFWGEAALTATYIQNRLPTTATGMTPYERWYGQKPSYDHFRIFGCEAWVHIPKERRNKMNSKAERLRFVGYSREQKAYRFVNEDTSKIVISRDAVFKENFNHPSWNEDILKKNKMRNQDHDIGETDDISDVDSCVSNESDAVSDDAFEDANGVFPSESEDLPSTTDRPTRENRGKPPAYLDDYIVGIAKSEDIEPTSWQEAMKSSHHDEWKEAMDAEMFSHEKNSTWEVTELPPDKKAIGCRWVFKLKKNELGNVVRFKARLVAQGFNQQYGVDYDETFAPVTRFNTIRVFLTICGRDRLIAKHLDVATAYLHGDIKEEIYMRQPPGYSLTGQGTKVCKLKRSIYGLKQAARCWNQKLCGVLESIGFKASVTDPCLFMRIKDNSKMYLVTYVDDLLVACKNENEIDNVYTELKKHFEINMLGDVKNFLGVQIIKNQDGILSLSMTRHIDELALKFGLEKAKVARTPMDSGYLKCTDRQDMFEDNNKYRSIVGSLMYIANCGRPDIAASASILGRKLECPSKTDWVAAKRVVRYLIGTRDWCLRLGDGKARCVLEVYTDADWAGDHATRKSTTGYVLFYGGGAVAWGSRRQNCVSLSSMEAEYVAITESCQETLWIRRLLRDLGEEQLGATFIHEDNQGCISFAQSGKISKRSKHIETKEFFVRDLIDRKEIELRYCPTEDMIADILTKALGNIKHKKFSLSLGLTDPVN